MDSWGFRLLGRRSGVIANPELSPIRTLPSCGSDSLSILTGDFPGVLLGCAISRE